MSSRNTDSQVVRTGGVTLKAKPRVTLNNNSDTTPAAGSESAATSSTTGSAAAAASNENTGSNQTSGTAGASAAKTSVTSTGTTAQSASGNSAQNQTSGKATTDSNAKTGTAGNTNSSGSINTTAKPVATAKDNQSNTSNAKTTSANTGKATGTAPLANASNQKSQQQTSSNRPSTGAAIGGQSNSQYQQQSSQQQSQSLQGQGQQLVSKLRLSDYEQQLISSEKYLCSEEILIPLRKSLMHLIHGEFNVENLNLSNDQDGTSLLESADSSSAGNSNTIPVQPQTGPQANDKNSISFDTRVNDALQCLEDFERSFESQNQQFLSHSELQLSSCEVDRAVGDLLLPINRNETGTASGMITFRRSQEKSMKDDDLIQESDQQIIDKLRREKFNTTETNDDHHNENFSFRIPSCYQQYSINKLAERIMEVASAWQRKWREECFADLVTTTTVTNSAAADSTGTAVNGTTANSSDPKRRKIDETLTNNSQSQIDTNLIMPVANSTEKTDTTTTVTNPVNKKSPAPFDISRTYPYWPALPQPSLVDVAHSTKLQFLTQELKDAIKIKTQRMEEETFRRHVAGLKRPRHIIQRDIRTVQSDVEEMLTVRERHLEQEQISSMALNKIANEMQAVSQVVRDFETYQKI